MLVRNRMSPKAITVEPDEAVDAARALMHRHGIRQLPVVRQQRLVGIVTDRDVRGAGASQKSVADLMTPKPIVIGPNASVDEAARLLTSHKIGALPVVENGKLVGVISSSDILNAFVDLSGVGEPTYRIVVSQARGKQAEREVRQIIETRRGELKWVHPDTHDANKVHVRLKARRIDDIVTGLEAAGFEVDALVAPSRR